MGGYVYVMEQKDFDNWLAGNVSGQTPVEMGRDLFENKLGCASCHAGGPQQRGAKLEGIYGKEVKLVGGQAIVADDQYIRNSILNPASQIVEGYQPIMPTFKGQVTDEQLNGLVAYIKSLSGVTGSTGGTTTPASSANTATNSATAPPSNSMTPPRANRGSNSQGSNPNAPGASNSNR
jgi:cytochrome c oxidase subunit 2